jgi:hypothetical protein
MGLAGTESSEDSVPSAQSRSTRSLRSGMHSFGMHTHGSADLDVPDSGLDVVAADGAGRRFLMPPAAAADLARSFSPSPRRLEPHPEHPADALSASPARSAPASRPTLSASPFQDPAPCGDGALPDAAAAAASHRSSRSAPFGSVFANSEDGRLPTGAGELTQEGSIAFSEAIGGVAGGATALPDAAGCGPADACQVTAAVQREVPEATVLLHCADEITFRLPRESVHAFPALLRALEVRTADLTASACACANANARR